MKKLKKFALIVFILGLVTASCVVGYVTMFVDVNSFRPQLETAAEEKLGRDITLGELGVSFFPSIAITADGLKVDGVDGGPAILETSKVRVGAALGPLVQKRLEVSEIVLVEPTIHLSRDADGKWDVLELLAKQGEGSGESKGAISIAALRVDSGRVVIKDARVSPGELVTHEFTDLNLDLRDLNLERRRVSFSLGLPTMGAGTGSFDGTIGPANAVKGEFESQDIALGKIAPYLAAYSPALAELDGRLATDLRLERDSAGAGRVEGTLDVTGLRLPTSLKSAPKLDAALTVDASLDEKGGVQLDDLELSTGKTKLRFSNLAFEQSATSRTFEVELPETEVHVADLRALAGAAGQELELDDLLSKSLHVGLKARAELKAKDSSDERVLKRLMISQLRVRGAKVRVRRDKEGRFSFQGDEEPKKAKNSKTDEGPTVAIKDMRVSEISGRLVDSREDGSKITTEFENLTVQLDEYVPGRKAGLKVAADLAGGRLTLDGDIGPVERGTVPLNVTLKLSALDLSDIEPYLERHAGFSAKAGTLNLNSKLKGKASETLQIKGQLGLQGARIEVAGKPPATLDLNIDHDLSIRKGGERIELTQLSLALPSGPLSVTGSLDLPKDGVPSFDIKTTQSARLGTDDLRKLVALLGEKMPAELEAAEPIEVSGRVRKLGETFNVSGDVSLRRVTVRHAMLPEPLQIAKANVGLSGEKLEFRDVSLRLGRSDLQGWLTFDGFKKHDVAFDFSSREADLDQLFSFLEQEEADEAAPSGDPSKDSALSNTKGRGRLSVDRASLGGLKFTKFKGDVRFDGGDLTVRDLSLDLYDGRATGSAAVNLDESPSPFNVKAKLVGVSVKDLLSDGMGYQDLSGIAEAELTLTGHSGPVDAALRSVKGSGSAKMTDGEISGLNVLAALDKAKGLGESSLAALGNRLAAEGTVFDRLDADYSLDSGSLHFDNIRIDTPDANISAKGPVSLLNQRLDLDGRILFTQEMSAQMRREGSKVASFFWDDKRQVVRVPLQLVGTVAEPEAKVDMEEAMSRLAERKIKDEVRKGAGGLLGKLLGGDEKQEDTNEGSQEQTPPESKTESGTSSGGLLGTLLGGGSKKEPAPSPPAAGGKAEPTKKEEGGTNLLSGSSSSTGSTKVDKGAPVAALKRVRYSGNFLKPDLKLEGSLKGTDLSHALLEVKDGEGRVVHRDAEAFKAQVDAHYESNPRDAEATVGISYKLDGSKILGVQGIVVHVTPVSRAGKEGKPVSKGVEAKKLF